MNLNSYKECLELVFGSSMPKKKTWTGQLDDDKGLPKVKVFELKGIGPSERKIAEQLGLRRHQVRRIIQKPVVDATKPATKPATTG
jgi:DNA invertase Pin-like site-specific DNA recombinase